MAFTKSSPVCGQREWAILTFKDAEVTGDFNTLIVKSEGQTVGEFVKSGIKRWYFELKRRTAVAKNAFARGFLSSALEIIGNETSALRWIRRLPAGIRLGGLHRS